jgi:hypothetical protein
MTSESGPPDDGLASFVRRAEQIRATDGRAEEEVRQRQELHAEVENVFRRSSTSERTFCSREA